MSDADPFPMSMGELIRRQRELAAVPMRQFASMVGISGPYLSQIENGLRAPSEQVLRNIAEHLGVPVSDLVDERTEDDTDSEEAMRDLIKADPNLTAAQRRALTEVYVAMVTTTRGQRAATG